MSLNFKTIKQVNYLSSCFAVSSGYYYLIGKEGLKCSRIDMEALLDIPGAIVIEI